MAKGKQTRLRALLPRLNFSLSAATTPLLCLSLLLLSTSVVFGQTTGQPLQLQPIQLTLTIK
jgi:hypothetical protein